MEGGTVKKKHLLVLLAMVAIAIVVIPAAAMAGGGLHHQTAGKIVTWQSLAPDPLQGYPFNTYPGKVTMSWKAMDGNPAKAFKGSISRTEWVRTPSGWEVWQSQAYAVTDVSWNAAEKCFEFYAPGSANVWDEGATGHFRAYGAGKHVQLWQQLYDEWYLLNAA
jgi:hypothetical protein